VDFCNVIGMPISKLSQVSAIAATVPSREVQSPLFGAELGGCGRCRTSGLRCIWRRTSATLRRSSCSSKKELPQGLRITYVVVNEPSHRNTARAQGGERGDADGSALEQAGFTPLMRAAYNNKVDAAHVLIQHSPDVVNATNKVSRDASCPAWHGIVFGFRVEGLGFRV
jgi:hypothetical protein